MRDEQTRTGRIEHVHCCKCKIPYNLAEGCALCQTARDNMEFPPLESEFEDTSVGSMIKQLMRMVKQECDRIENEMRKGHPKDVNKLDPTKSSPRHFQALMSLIKQSSGLLGEARKYEKQQSEAVNNLPLDDQLEILLTMLEEKFTFDHHQQAALRIGKLVARLEPGEIVDE